MAKAWRIIGSVVIIFVILGIVLVGVGILTGADPDRLWQSIAEKFNWNSDYRVWLQYVSDLWAALWKTVSSAHITF